MSFPLPHFIPSGFLPAAVFSGAGRGVGTFSPRQGWRRNSITQPPYSPNILKLAANGCWPKKAVWIVSQFMKTATSAFESSGA